MTLIKIFPRYLSWIWEFKIFHKVEFLYEHKKEYFKKF